MVERPIELVLTRLEVSSERDGQYECRCPAHDDQKASLGVREGDDGKVILYCQAGCDTRDVVNSLGLEMGGLFPSHPRNGETSSGAQKNGSTNNMTTRKEKHRTSKQAPRHHPIRRADRNSGGERWDPFEEGRQAAAYAYVDEPATALRGRPLRARRPVTPAFPTRLSPARPEAWKRWTWSTKDIRRVLFRLPASSRRRGGRPSTSPKARRTSTR